MFPFPRLQLDLSMLICVLTRFLFGIFIFRRIQSFYYNNNNFNACNAYVQDLILKNYKEREDVYAKGKGIKAAVEKIQS